MKRNQILLNVDSAAGLPVGATVAAPAAEPARKKFTGLKSTNSARAKAPKRTDVAAMGLAVDTKLTDLPKEVAKFQAMIAQGIKDGSVIEGIDLSDVKLADIVVRGTVYAQVVEAAE